MLSKRERRERLKRGARRYEASVVASLIEKLGPGEWLTSKQVAERFDLKAAWLASKRQKGGGPIFARIAHPRHGWRVFYRASDIKRWIHAQKHKRYRRERAALGSP